MIVWVLKVLLVSSSFSTTLSFPLGTSYINCQSGTNVHLGRKDEGFAGNLDVMRGIKENDTIALEAYNYPSHLDFLELNVTTGNASLAVIQTRKPLDAEALKDSRGYLYYAIRCLNTGKLNIRLMQINNINDNPPVFEKAEYREIVPETCAVGSVVLTVKAVDADVSPANGKVIYTILPPVPTAFELREDGSIFLNESLNYNSISSYKFTMQASDEEGLSSTADVIIDVRDVDNLSPYFQYSVYETNIQENWVGTVPIVYPEAVQAWDGDKGINETLIYSISSVSPSIYQSEFHIDFTTGVLSVVKSLDREEIITVILGIKASQQDDIHKTAESTFIVNIADVPEAPSFSSPVYAAEIFNIAPYKFSVLKVKATDPDVGETEALKYSLVKPSSMFDVEPSSGQVYVVSVAGESGKVSLQVKAEDKEGLYDTTTVEVTVKESGSNNVAVLSLNMAVNTVEDNAPQVEESLGRALGWTVRIMSVTSVAELFQREVLPKTYISFIAMVPGSAIVLPNEEIKQRLQSEEESVKAELGKVFGPGLEITVEEGTTGPILRTDNHSTVITLGVFLGIFMALVPASVFITRRLSRGNHNIGTSLTLETNDMMSRL